jgi:hypothetical protein
MTYLVSQSTRYQGAVMVDASLLASCSGSIARSQNSDTTHSFYSFKKSSNLGCNSVLPQSPQKTITNRGFSAVGFEAAIGGAV